MQNTLANAGRLLGVCCIV